SNSKEEADGAAGSAGWAWPCAQQSAPGMTQSVQCGCDGLLHFFISKAYAFSGMRGIRMGFPCNIIFPK
ncbi:MAG: hypothetical protein ACLGI6_21460, partial [Gammaproteobacteria bacterium]